MKVDALLETIDQLTGPIAKELSYEIYHIEYVKEDGKYYLRIYVGKDSGIALSDCEALSRRVNDVMDEKDPVKEAYSLEVLLPGLNRALFTDDRFKKRIGKEIVVRFTESLSRGKNIKGILREVSGDSVIVETDDLITIPKDKIKSANLGGEI